MVRVCPHCAKEVTKPGTSCTFCGGALSALPTPEERLIGHMIADKYRLIRHLRSGGMGQLYLAKHLVFDEDHTIKTIHRHTADDRELHQRFLLEANLTRKASQKSEHIVYVHDFGYDEKLGNYIAMEYLRGEPLSTLLKSSYEDPPNLSRILSILAQACDAMQVAHDLGIIHRDLKPSNLFLTQAPQGWGEEDFVKVIDFGVARPEEGVVEGYETIGNLVGTPAYMAPEQILSEEERAERGWAFDHRVDIYALGITLYKALVGKTPFRKSKTDRTSYWSIWQGHLTQQPFVPHERAPERQIPPFLSPLVLRALEKDPARRYPSMAAFAETLREARARVWDENLDAQFRPRVVFQEAGDGLAGSDRSDSLNPGASAFQGAVSSQVWPSPRRRMPLLLLGASLGVLMGFLVWMLLPGDKTTQNPSVRPVQKRQPPLQKRAVLARRVVPPIRIGALPFKRAAKLPSRPVRKRPALVIKRPVDARARRPAPPSRRTAVQSSRQPLGAYAPPPRPLGAYAPPRARPRTRPSRRPAARATRALRVAGCPSPAAGFRMVRLRSQGVALHKIMVRVGGVRKAPDRRGCVQVRAGRVHQLYLSYKPDPTEYHLCKIRLHRRKRQLVFRLVDAYQLRPAGGDCSR